MKQKIPLLGICGGHELIAFALGQEIILNQKGRELGTVKCTLTKNGQKDPLFEGVPKNFLSQISHRCALKNLDKKWKLLAFSKFCSIQAVAINERTRILQFHPELSAKDLKYTIKRKKEGLNLSGCEFWKFLASVREAPYGKKFLKIF